jgi:hypothetical protein
VSDDISIPSPTYRVPHYRGGMDPATRKLAMIAAGIGGILLVAVGGWTMLNHHSHGVPVVQADSGPLRVKPTNPGGLQVAGAGNEIFSGGSDTDVEKLAPPPETPDPLGLRGSPTKPAPVARTPAAEAAPHEAAAVPHAAEAAPHEAAVAAHPASGVATRETATAVHHETTKAGPREAATGRQAATAAPREATAATPHQMAVGTPRDVAVGAGQAPPTASHSAVAAALPVAAAPGQAVAAGAPLTRPAEKPASTTVADEHGVGGKRASVQLAALTSEEAARAEWDRMVKRWPELFGGHQPAFSKVEHGGQVFWRLRTGGFEGVGQATTFCEHLRAKGGGCSVADF